ncbi:hypothetical protein BIW11_03386 [Tropilaelaps mercedesae]|uniref:Uncharacterized protein n=1 Tax=Tropilaelaps mercedesae TaxID=418985 RepID=A0A1V9XMS3_9ACAR|nr:hypothetical protein BIW11_03386 [Tropilaelaps mercedesae]
MGLIVQFGMWFYRSWRRERDAGLWVHCAFSKDSRRAWKISSVELVRDPCGTPACAGPRLFDAAHNRSSTVRVIVSVCQLRRRRLLYCASVAAVRKVRNAVSDNDYSAVSVNLERGRRCCEVCGFRAKPVLRAIRERLLTFQLFWTLLIGLLPMSLRMPASICNDSGVPTDGPPHCRRRRALKLTAAETELSTSLTEVSNDGMALHYSILDDMPAGCGVGRHGGSELFGLIVWRRIVGVSRVSCGSCLVLSEKLLPSRCGGGRGKANVSGSGWRWSYEGEIGEEKT